MIVKYKIVHSGEKRAVSPRGDAAVTSPYRLRLLVKSLLIVFACFVTSPVTLESPLKNKREPVWPVVQEVLANYSCCFFCFNLPLRSKYWLHSMMAKDNMKCMNVPDNTDCPIASAGWAAGLSPSTCSLSFSSLINAKINFVCKHLAADGLRPLRHSFFSSGGLLLTAAGVCFVLLRSPLNESVVAANTWYSAQSCSITSVKF